MADANFEVTDPDGRVSVVHSWSVPDGADVRAVVHLLHGWGEHALRYDRFARRLAGVGVEVYADDHRGHGQSGVRSNTLGDLGPRGGDGVLDAVKAVHDEVQRRADAHASTERTAAPVVLFGHSWGSFLAQSFLRRWPELLDAVVLTGTTFRDPDSPAAARRPANERFEPARTPYDWLSRDEAEVDAYIADPLCGFEFLQGRSPSTTAGRSTPGVTPSAVALPPPLPILILNGSDDPIGGEEGGVALAEHLRSRGAEDVTTRFWPGARHELLNETVRDEVEAEIVGWLDRVLEGPRVRRRSR